VQATDVDDEGAGSRDGDLVGEEEGDPVCPAQPTSAMHRATAVAIDLTRFRVIRA
jgi:hypothetical protein